MEIVVVVGRCVVAFFFVASVDVCGLWLRLVASCSRAQFGSSLFLDGFPTRVGVKISARHQGREDCSVIFSSPTVRSGTSRSKPLVGPTEPFRDLSLSPEHSGNR